MEHEWQCCQTSSCRIFKYQAQYLHKVEFKIHCAKCLTQIDRENYYLEIASIKDKSKKQLKEANLQMQKNQTQIISQINESFKNIINNIQMIKNKIIGCIQEFKFPEWVLKFCDKQKDYVAFHEELHKVIKNYFHIENNTIELNQHVKQNIQFPTVIRDKIIEFFDRIKKFNEDLISSVKNAQQIQQEHQQQNQLIQQSIFRQTTLESPVPNDLIKFMKDDDDCILKNIKDIQFTLKPKLNITLQGIQFGQGSQSEQINLFIKNKENKIIYEKKGLIVGSKNNYVIKFIPQILEKEKEYTIQIKQTTGIELKIFKQGLENDFVELLGQESPIESLLVAKSQ